VMATQCAGLCEPLPNDSGTRPAGGLELNSPAVNEMRCDPWTGRRVFIAEGRSGRPNDFADVVEPVVHSDGQEVVEHCPFCTGNEHHTPESLVRIDDDQGNWQIRVVPNKYPAVTPS